MSLTAIAFLWGGILACLYFPLRKWGPGNVWLFLIAAFIVINIAALIAQYSGLLT